MDPLSIMTIVASGLKLVDQFRDMVLKFRGTKPNPPSGKVEKAGSNIEISMDNTVYQTIKPSEVQMDQWDSVRYTSLETRIKLSWGVFNELYAQEPLYDAQEGARARVRMKTVQEELCKDFREMVEIYERVLNASIPDHYKLYEVCGN